jgi:2-keto-4-pentenoate hydratase
MTFDRTHRIDLADRTTHQGDVNMTSYVNAAHDGLLDAGMEAQQELLRTAEARGATQAGWKAGFGTRHWRDTFGLDAPLVGFLLDTTLVPVGTPVSLAGWTAPRAEAELAMRLGSDVSSGATAEEALAAVEALAPAIELVDMTPAPEGPSIVLAGDIYHRHWITGTFAPMPPDGDLSGLVGHVTAMGEAMDPVRDVQAATGRAGEVLAEVARIAQRHGRGLRAGDVVILGSIVPPTPVAAGGSFHYVLGDHAPLEVALTD